MRKFFTGLCVMGMGVWLVACGLSPGTSSSTTSSPGSQTAQNQDQTGSIRLRLDQPTVLPRAIRPRANPVLQQVVITVHQGGKVIVGPLTFPVNGQPGPLEFPLTGVPLGQDILITAVGLDQTGAEVSDFERGLRLAAGGSMVVQGSITPIADVLSGIALLQPVQPLLPELVDKIEALGVEGFLVTEDNQLFYPPSLAVGWKVRAGNQEARVERDGTFRLVRPDPGVTTATLVHPTHRGYESNFPLAELSSGQRATQPIFLIQPFDGGCGMSPNDDVFCRGPADPLPRRDEARVRALNVDPSITTDDCGYVIPAPTEAEQLDRGHYPKPNDTSINGDFREVECHNVCEQDNGVFRDGLPGAREESKYLGSTCHLFVRAGFCPNENTFAGVFNLVQSGLGLVTNSISRATSLLSFGRLPRRPFPSLVNTLGIIDGLTCQDNHKGRECQQVLVSDISLDFRDSGKVGFVLRPPNPTQIIAVRPGERVDFVVHNNGGYGITLAQLRQRDIPGNLVRTYRELPFNEKPLPQNTPLRQDKRSNSTDPLLRNAPIFGKYRAFASPSELDVTPTVFGFFSGETKEIRHFFETGTRDSNTPCEHYRYFCDVAIQYRVPITARPGTRDHYSFSTDNCEVPVIFEVVGEGGLPPSDSPTPSETPSPSESPTPSPTATPVDLITVGPAISNSHTVGVSPCPQLIGGLAIGNRTQENVAIQVSVNHVAIELEPPTSLTLPANGATVRDVFFNCAIQQSFQAVITVTATRLSDGRQEVETVPVAMNVQ